MLFSLKITILFSFLSSSFSLHFFFNPFFLSPYSSWSPPSIFQEKFVDYDKIFNVIADKKKIKIFLQIKPLIFLNLKSMPFQLRRPAAALRSKLGLNFFKIAKMSFPPKIRSCCSSIFSSFLFLFLYKLVRWIRWRQEYTPVPRSAR